MIAANNVFNALFMVGSALITIGLLSVGLGAGEIILLAGVATGVVTVALCLREPEFVTGMQTKIAEDSGR